MRRSRRKQRGKEGPIADLEVIRAKLIADAHQFIAEIERAKGVLGTPGGNGGLAGAAKQSSRAMHVLRGGMVGLATQATGTAGPVGRISQGLLLMGGGSTAVLGAAAGIGAVALAIRAMTQDARDNAAAQQAMMKALDQLGPHAQVTAARMQIAELERLRDAPTLFERGKIAGKALLGPLLGGASFAEQTAIIEREIARLKTLMGRLGRELDQPQATIAAQRSLRELRAAFEDLAEPATVAVERMRRMRLEAEGVSPKAAALTAHTERLATEQKLSNDAMRDSILGFTEAQIKLNMLGASVDEVTEAITRFRLSAQGVPEDTAVQVAQTQRQTAQMLREVADVEALREIGISAGRQLMLGVAEGMFNMRDFLKSVFLELLSYAATDIFSHLLGKFGGGLSSGKNIGEVVKPASFALQVPGTLAAPATPFAVMRDADWQAMLRGSLIVARGDGFR